MKINGCFAAALLCLTSLALAQPAVPKPGEPYRGLSGNPNQLKNEVLWAGQCEEPAGAGLAFSGQSQVADDGQPHTADQG